MADNTQINPGAAGDVIRDLDRGTAKTQVMALDAGGQAGEALVSSSRPLPADLVNATPDQPVAVQIVGDAAGDFAGINLLETVMDDGSGIAVNVKVVNPQRRDANGSPIKSDAAGPIYLSGPTGTVYLIDTAGYQTLQISSSTGVGSLQGSGDRVTFHALCGQSLIGSTASGYAANSSWQFPCTARYIKVTVSTSGNAVAYLRDQPMQAIGAVGVPSFNLATVAGVSAFSVGNGTFAVSGSVTPGTPPAVNLGSSVGGVDGSGLYRHLSLSSAGVLNVSTADTAIDQTGVARNFGLLSPLISGVYGVASQAVQEVSQVEGQSLGELMLQILTELRIVNHQLFLLNTQGGASPSDEPAAFRNDAEFTKPN